MTGLLFFWFLPINTSYPVVSVLPATATTAIIACTDRVEILYMFNRLTQYLLKQKTPVSRPGFEISFLNNIRPARMNFSPLPLLPEELLCSWA